jgi:predicted ATP-grasp superfamily ATP-dependent carboligase
MAVYTISEYRDSLAERFPFRLPSHDMVLTLHDRVLFHEFAVANGTAGPNAVIGNSDLCSIRDVRFPVIINPAEKRDFYIKGVARAVLASDQ